MIISTKRNIVKYSTTCICIRSYRLCQAPFGSSTFNHGVSSGFYNGVVDRSLRLEIDVDSAYLFTTELQLTLVSGL